MKAYGFKAITSNTLIDPRFKGPRLNAERS